jgi:Sulfotransferase family
MRQIFIFSLPRSGSTLLQRTLMVHDKIATTSEPWIMLPQVYSYKETGSLSEYSNLLSSKGVNDLINNLPNKQKDYNESLRDFITDIHKKLARKNETYFLDKTPRYFLIIPEIIKIFPDAKFIFLFRSPEQIYSSMLQTWSKNKLKPFLGSYYDLTEGYEKLSLGYSKFKKKSIVVKYEDFVVNPEVELKRIMNYLDLKYDSKMIKGFSKQNTGGRLGDPTGIINYDKISIQSLEKWKKTFNTSFRKKIACNIINKISNEALKTQGYDKQNILKSIKEIESNLSIDEIKDLYDYFSNYLIRKYNLHLFYSKNYKWVKRKFIS